MDDDDVDDLWGPPLVVKDDTFRKPPLRGCEFWFDFRTDVLEESFQIGRNCELVWTILNEKKQVSEILELDKDVAFFGSGGSSDSDKTLSATLPDADTSSAKSSLEEDENTSSISDALTIEIKDPTNHTEEIDPETSLNPQDEANDPITVEVAEDRDTSSIPLLALASKIDEAEEHSCSSLVTQVFDPIKQAPENKSPSAISQESNESLRPLVETREKANATNEDGEVLKDQQQKQSGSWHEIETASEPYTTESLLEMCDDPEQHREAPRKRSMPEAVKTVVKEEPIIDMLTEARIKPVESKALLNPHGPVLIKKRKRTSNSSNNKGMSTSLIRNTKQKVGGEATPSESKPKGPSVPPLLSASTLDLIDRIRQRGRKKTMGEEPVILISELNDKTGKELRSIAKELKVTRYYKMKKEDLLQSCIMQLKLKLTDCKEQRVEP